MSFLILVGLIVMLVGGILFLIEAFKESVLWGFGCLLLSPVSLVFLFLHWDAVKMPFLIQLGGLALFAIGGGFSAPAEVLSTGGVA